MPDGPRLALRHDAWWTLTPDERRRWLLHFVSEERNSCLSGELPPAATISPAAALSIAGHWLHPEPFLRGLAERGFELAPMDSDLTTLPSGAVILFVDGEARPQHAAYYLGEGLVLNKDAQGWFVPRQIRPVAELLADWLADSMRAHIYVRR